jgi:hypothetical protein
MWSVWRSREGANGDDSKRSLWHTLCRTVLVASARVCFIGRRGATRRRTITSGDRFTDQNNFRFCSCGTDPRELNRDERELVDHVKQRR